MQPGWKGIGFTFAFAGVVSLGGWRMLLYLLHLLGRERATGDTKGLGRFVYWAEHKRYPRLTTDRRIGWTAGLLMFVHRRWVILVLWISGCGTLG